MNRPRQGAKAHPGQLCCPGCCVFIILLKGLCPGTKPLHQWGAVADDEKAQVPPLCLFQEKGPDLGLGYEVQHGRELVTQEEPGGRSQGSGHAEPLELSAGELGGIAGEPTRLDVEPSQDPFLHRPTRGQGGT